jgi:hypothetical protein
LARSFLVGSLVALGGCATIVGAEFDDLKSRDARIDEAGQQAPAGSSGGTSGGGTTTSGGAPSGDVVDPTKPVATADGGGGGCTTMATFYEDKDGDGWGSARTVQACALAPGLSDKTGDCHDGDKNIFPGQTKYFAAPYTSPLGKASFDYDCNGSEDPTPNLVQFQSFPICSQTLTCGTNDNGKYCWEPQHAARAGGFEKCGARAWVCLAPAGWHLADTSENLKAYPCR